MHTLKLENLCIELNNKKILDNFNLEIKSGEIHAIMGPNGTGKSTLSHIIMGDSRYKLISGNIYFDDKNINTLTTDERARLGLFLGFQSPISIDGVTNADFMRTALHIKEQNKFNLMSFIKEINNECNELKINKEMIHRSINSGFSGGEKKKNEILQMKLLKPNMVILDEIDSGLDIDALKIVGQNVMDYYDENKPGVILITHYQRLLDYIKPDFVHIMKDGKIIKSGDITLVKEIEKLGYDKINSSNEVEASI